MRDRNSAERRTVSSRVSCENWCFKTRNKSLVTVCSRVGESEDGISVFDNSSDEVESHVTQTCWAVTSEKVFAACIVKRIMLVHTGTVISQNWLWHESCSLSMLSCNVSDNVLVPANCISSF